MDARLLNPGYRIPPDLMDQMPPPTSPAGMLVAQRGAPQDFTDTGVGALDDALEPAAAPPPMAARPPMAPSGGAALLAQAPRQSPVVATARSKPATARERGVGGDDVWTPERKAEADELNRIGRAYSQNVTKRRAQRKALSQYGKMQNALENAAGKLHELRTLKKNYPGQYATGDEHGLAFQRRIVEHFESSDRLRKELLEKAQELNSHYKVPLDKKGFIQDADGFLDETDKQFDNEAIDAMSGAFERQPAQ